MPDELPIRPNSHLLSNLVTMLIVIRYRLPFIAEIFLGAVAVFSALSAAHSWPLIVLNNDKHMNIHFHISILMRLLIFFSLFFHQTSLN